MSTTWYHLAEHVSSLRLERGERHDRLSVWENGAHAGTLTVLAELGGHFAKLFADHSPRGRVLLTRWGGQHVGRVVEELVTGLSDEMVIVSEMGDVSTVGAVRKTAGFGKVPAAELEQQPPAR